MSTPTDLQGTCTEAPQREQQQLLPRQRRQRHRQIKILRHTVVLKLHIFKKAGRLNSIRKPAICIYRKKRPLKYLILPGEVPLT